MMRLWIAAALALLITPGLVHADDQPLVQRGGLEGREFSEVGRIYIDDDGLMHFRTAERLYYFSHMYYIKDALEAAGVVKEGKITYVKPLRITGNYSKAKYVYNFLEEPPLRGSQIMWIDRVEKVELPPAEQSVQVTLFDGKSLKGWSTIPAAAGTISTSWEVKENVLLCSPVSLDRTQMLISETDCADFELTFEYRASWQTSASILLRANKDGEGIALSLDHVDEGTCGFPKSAAGASRPFMLYQTREEQGVGATAHFHIQYDGRVNYDAVARDKLLQCCTLGDFLNAWDGAYWNIVRISCIGREPEITVWVNGLQVSKFNAETVMMTDKLPDRMIGAIENYVVHPAGRIAFALHPTPDEEHKLEIREVHFRKL